MFNWERFSRVTNDGFFLAIEARDPRFTEIEAARAAGENRRPTYHHRARGLNMLRGFFLIFFCARSRSSPSSAFAGKKAPAADGSFPGHGATTESARAGAARFFCGWPRSAFASCRHGSDWLRNAETAKRRARARHRRNAPETHSRIAFSVGTDYYNTGKMGTNWGTGIPIPVDAELMERGQQRFNITCAMCHGATAAGNGITKQYGLATVVTLQDDRIRKMADGEIFNTITNGKNTMMAYGPNMTVRDRWAIIAYLRAFNAARTRRCRCSADHRADLDKPARQTEAKLRGAKNERTFTSLADAGRRIFRQRPFAGLSFLLGAIAFVASCSVGRRRVSRSASIQLIPGSLRLRSSSRFAPAVFSGPSCITPPTRNGSVVVRRQLENIAVLLAVLALFFIPILLLRHHLYEWMNIPPGHDAVLDAKRAYLNWDFFFVARGYLLCVFHHCVAAAAAIFRAPGQGRQSAIHASGCARLSFISLPLFALCLTFGAFDWLMSLNYHWFSTMWGVYIFAGAAGSSMSLLVLVITGFAQGRLSEGRRDDRALSHHGEMDARLLRFLGLHRLQPVHAHLVCQHPGRDAIFSRPKYANRWWALSLLLVFGRFFVPFAILLLQSIKKHPHQLCIVAGWMILMQMLDMYRDRFARVPRHGRSREYLGFCLR